MGIGFGKIILGVLILIVPLIILLTPLTAFLSLLPEGMLPIPPEAMGLVNALLTGKTVADLPEICDAVTAMAAGLGAAPAELTNICGLVTNYIPLILYAVYGMIAIGALIILWGLSPLFMGKKKDSPPAE